jgi:hypothetical protein
MARALLGSLQDEEKDRERRFWYPGEHSSILDKIKSF